MDIRGIFANGFLQQGIDQPDNGRVVFLLQQIRGFRQGIRQAGQVEPFQIIRRFRRRAALLLIGDRHGCGEGGIVHGHQPRQAPDVALHFPQGGHGNILPVAQLFVTITLAQQDTIAPREAVRQQRRRKFHIFRRLQMLSHSSVFFH